MKKRINNLTLTAATFMLICAGGCSEVPKAQAFDTPEVSAQQTASPDLIPVSAETHKQLQQVLADHQYHWESLDLGVPPLRLKSLPGDLNRVPEVQQRKDLFFLSLLPMVLAANNEIRLQKKQLQKLTAAVQLTPEEQQQLQLLARAYRVKGDILGNPKVRQELLRRVDVLPPSLVLAQAATESAYGTSRFARLGNNLFGEWTFTPGTGLVPEGRPEGETYEVRLFPSVYDSLRSYMKNLNTHWAYRSLRELRARVRAEGKPLRGTDLAEGLLLYSTRREAYVSDIRSIIRGNNLTRLNGVKLRRPQPALASDSVPGTGAGLFSSAAASSRSSRSKL